MIGMAFVVDDFPLYYEATSEKGLSIAGLNFPKNAKYYKPIVGKDNIPAFELIPLILSQAETVKEVRKFLEKINITDDSFHEELPPSPLHWMISDRDETIVFEQAKEGGKIYENPIGVMTNNPPFSYHLENLKKYKNISPNPPEINFSKELDLIPYGTGLGGFGLPGDWSSASRFIRASFVKLNSPGGDSEKESVSQFFKILGCVEYPKGACRVGEDEKGKIRKDYTNYSSCCNTDRGI